MFFYWSGLLVFLTVIPLLVMGFIWTQRRSKRQALRFSSLSLLRPALSRPSPVRRYLPPALFLLALTSLLVALARPAAVLTTPSNHATIILAMDVSGSMGATDISPNRLTAAETAALSFVENQKANTQIGIVAFSTNATPVLMPTANQTKVEDAIRSLTIGNSTAIGSGIIESLKVIDQTHKQNQPTAQVIQHSASKTAPDGKKYAPEIIVLLTDGVNNSGPLPQFAAGLAATRGVRVYPIGYGPEYPVDNTDNPGGAQNIIPNTGGTSQDQNGLAITPKYDMETLQSVAKQTGGQFYTAANASQLEKVLEDLPIQTTYQTETTEISIAFVALGGLLASAAMVLSLLWHPLP